MTFLKLHIQSLLTTWSLNIRNKIQTLLVWLILHSCLKYIFAFSLCQFGFAVLVSTVVAGPGTVRRRRGLRFSDWMNKCRQRFEIGFPDLMSQTTRLRRKFARKEQIHTGVWSMGRDLFSATGLLPPQPSHLVGVTQLFKKWRTDSSRRSMPTWLAWVTKITLLWISLGTVKDSSKNLDHSMWPTFGHCSTVARESLSV